MSTSGYPGTGGGSRVYTGRGNNGTTASGSNYIDIGGLSAGTTYYFTCTSYNDALGWGNSYNVTAATIQFMTDISNWIDFSYSEMRSTIWCPLGNSILFVKYVSGTPSAQVITINGTSITKGSKISINIDNIKNYGGYGTLVKISNTKVVMLCGSSGRTPAEVFSIIFTISGNSVSYTFGSQNSSASMTSSTVITTFLPTGIGSFHLEGYNSSNYSWESSCTIDTNGNVSFSGSWSKSGSKYNTLSYSDIMDNRTIRGGGVCGNESGTNAHWAYTSSGAVKTQTYDCCTFYNGNGYTGWCSGSETKIFYISGTSSSDVILTLSNTRKLYGLFMNNSKNRLLVFTNERDDISRYDVRVYSITNNTSLSLINSSSFTSASGLKHVLVQTDMNCAILIGTGSTDTYTKKMIWF